MAIGHRNRYQPRRVQTLTRASFLGVAAVLLTATACASSSDPATAPTTDATVDDSDVFIKTTDNQQQVPTASDSLAASDRPPAEPDAALPVSITNIDFDDKTITITNHGGFDVDLGEIWICEFPDYATLDAGTLAGGMSVTIPNPHDSAADDGELALYRTDTFDEADAMLSYIEWGSSGHKRSTVATAAGLWGLEAVGAGLVLDTGGAFVAEASGWSVLKTLTGETVVTRPSVTPSPTTTRPPRTTSPGTTSPRTTSPGTTSPGNAPPPDDYSGSPAAPSPSQPTSPPGSTAVPNPPPDNYSPAAPAAPLTPAPAAPPPPDDY
jgi:hypothetical protein